VEASAELTEEKDPLTFPHFTPGVLEWTTGGKPKVGSRLRVRALGSDGN
jgi:hypothetical protein